ncbi:MAG: hypothetical protein H0T04_03530 [Chloroflexi bacterium]|nr:hypothetical protein [Chloroflexota bacterium]MBA3852200.1 hypothetical protein [Chloroflexota bacterium]
MTVLAPGVTTLPLRGWRAGVTTAFVVTLGRPSLWLLGSLGFAARGGFLLLALPIITIPSPVVLSVIFRGRFAATGISSELELVVALLVAGLLLGGLLLAALADVAAFERLIGDPESGELRAGVDARPLERGEGRRLVLTLAGIQALALLPAAIVSLGLYQGLTSLVISEVQAPSSLETPLVLRVLEAARDPLLAFALLLLLADTLYALASRAVLARHFRVGLPGRPRPSGAAAAAIHGAERLVVRPLRTLATGALAWSVSLVVLLPIVWASSVAWDGVRGAYLAPGGLSEPTTLLLVFLVSLAFAAIWVAGSILAGFASALRAALWSAEALR